jgi:hypothetical protein
MPLRSAQRRYMRSSISAQSWLSVPPAPGWMVTMAARASFSPESSMPSSSFSRRAAKRLHLAARVGGDVLAFAPESNSVSMSDRRARHGRPAHGVFQALALLHHFWLLLRVGASFQKSGELIWFPSRDSSCLAFSAGVKDSSARRQPAGGAERTLYPVLRGS